MRSIERRRAPGRPATAGVPRLAVVLVVALLVALAACSDEGGGAEAPPTTGPEAVGPRYEARIRYTSHRIPHIEAEDLGSLAFGQGWAQADAHACTIADQILKVRSQRARYLGPGQDGRSNIDSDVAYVALGVHDDARQRYDELGSDAREVLDGFAAGFNTWLDETESGAVPDWCAGEDWLRPITAVDVLAQLEDLALIAGSRNLLGPVALAEPPGRSDPADAAVGETGSPDVAAGSPPASEEASPPLPAVGGVGWAFGGEATGTGRGMLAAAPQLPWQGELRLWEQHLTVPGELDVYGVSLIGVPAVLVGFNDAVAWTHTVAGGSRLALYQLSLVPGDPTSYRIGDEVEAMTSEELIVEVLQPDGSVDLAGRTLWSSRFGPMVEVPGLGWSESTAVSVRDATRDVTGFLEQWLDMARSDSLDDVRAAHAEHAATMWVDTLAVSADGESWYANAAATPALPADALARWEQALVDDPIVAAVAAQGGVLLDGSDPDTAWEERPGAAAPGLVPFADAPQHRTAGLLVAGDHGHWAVDPDEPVTGFPAVYGPEGVALTPTSRQSLLLATTVVAGADEEGAAVTLDAVRAALLDEESLTAELLRDDVIDRCRDVRIVRVPEQRAGDELVWASQEVRLDRACSALANWDGRFDIESRGALVWRELLHRFDRRALTSAGELFDVPFDPSDPVGTPSGLAEPPTDGPDPVMVALGEALLTLDEVGLEPDAALRDVQEAVRGVDRLPIHGGHAGDGTVVQVGTDRLSTTSEPLDPATEARIPGSELTEDGYLVTAGTGFVLVVEFTADGPRAEAILAYGQSGDPTSPYFADQTYRFSDKAWRPVRFSEAAISDDPALEEVVVGAPRADP